MPRQLLMVHYNPAGTPKPVVPPGIELTTYRPGDEADWIRLLAAGQLSGVWTLERARRDLLDKPAFRPDGFFIARRRADDEALATACAFAQRAFDHDWPGLHMVAAAVEVRGRGLGKLVVQAVQYYWGQQHAGPIILTTDDFRLPAIATYLKLGWRPIRTREEGEDHTQRWQEAWHKLAAPAEWRIFARPLI